LAADPSDARGEVSGPDGAKKARGLLVRVAMIVVALALVPLLWIATQMLAGLVLLVLFPFAAAGAFIAIGTWMLVFLCLHFLLQQVVAALERAGVPSTTTSDVYGMAGLLVMLIAGVVAFFVTRWYWRWAERSFAKLQAWVRDKLPD
jgi:hypothetical protein